MSTETKTNDEVFELNYDAETQNYSCSECLITFKDSDEHLRLYHNTNESETLEFFEIIVNQQNENQIQDFDGFACVASTNDGKMQCEKCSKTFKSLKRFIEHLRSHGMIFQDKIKQLENALFTEVFEPNYEEVVIIDDDHGEKVYYKCLECSTLFEKKKNFLLHHKIHLNNRRQSPAISTRLNCKICNKSMDNQKTLEMHMKAHSDNFSHQLRKPYHIKDELISNEKLNKLACQYCGKIFKRPVEKVKHERVHSGEKPFSCEICGKSFRVSHCLTLHKRSVHSEERPFVCTFEDCHRRFKSQSVYNHHLACHGTEKNHICPFCSKAFKTPVQLAGHKNTHTKPFNCDHCTRTFSSLYAAKSHMETHLGSSKKLKFECKICSAAYGRSFALNDHMKSTHPEVSYEAIQIE